MPIIVRGAEQHILFQFAHHGSLIRGALFSGGFIENR